MDNRKLNAKTKRNGQIISMIKKGKTFTEIGKKFKITKQRVHEIAKNNGISRWEISRENNEDLVTKIKHDFEIGFSYEEMCNKYNLRNGKLKAKLSYYGFKSIYNKFLNRRNEEIVTKYKIKTAKDVIKDPNPALDSPKRVLSLDSIYNISSRNGFKKYPKIGNRNKGGLFEEPKVIKFIKDKRDINKLSFRKIAELLNTKGYKTPMGMEYSAANTRNKYLAIKKQDKNIL